jgi:hypothetical protein
MAERYRACPKLKIRGVNIMPIPENPDKESLAEAALAILSLSRMIDSIE